MEWITSKISGIKRWMFGGKDLVFPKLSESDDEPIKELYDVIVIGSGYGGGIAASRAARTGNSVCVLERGKEWQPGDFPEESLGAAKEIQLKCPGDKQTGNGLELYNFNLNKEVVILTGNGLGGTSLINANVALETDQELLNNTDWPSEFREDLENFQKYTKHAQDMLKPVPYETPAIKNKQMEAIADHIMDKGLPDIEDIGTLFKVRGVKKQDFFYKTPLYVNMEDRSKTNNHVGMPQPACNGCGNCTGGCNTGAKNTINMNYLPDAKFHGAEIFTKVKVQYIQKSPQDDGTWQVLYKRHGENVNRLVTAPIVIVSAGTLGSTEIMLRSKEKGLDVSDELGKDYSSNGDQIGFSFNGKEKTNSIGIESNYDPKKHDPPPGPCIVNVLDFRKLLPKDKWRKGFIVEDGTPSKSTSLPYKILLYLGSLIFKDTVRTNDTWRSLPFKTFRYLGSFIFTSLNNTWRHLISYFDGTADDKSLAMLGMGYDNLPDPVTGEVNSGTITLDEDGVKVEWKNVRQKEQYKNLDAAYKAAAEALGGIYMEDPLSSAHGRVFQPLLTGKNTISVHPLGGCVMADTGHTGVVNHKGQVFVGKSDDVHDGLYIIDGSILPSAVCVNPTLTISGVAERCMALMAKDHHWGEIDYSFEKDPAHIKLTDEKKPGARVPELMKGNVLDVPNKTETFLKTELDLMTTDLEFTLKEARHRFDIEGNVFCQTLSAEPMTCRGTVDMFVESKETPGLSLMIYKLKVVPSDRRDHYYLHGEKYMMHDKPFQIGYHDSTTLYVKVFKGQDQTGKLLVKGQIHLSALDIANALKGMIVTNAKGGFLGSLRWKCKFAQLFLREMWDIYSPFAKHQRRKRPLNIPKQAQRRERTTMKALQLFQHYINRGSHYIYQKMQEKYNALLGYFRNFEEKVHFEWHLKSKPDLYTKDRNVTIEPGPTDLVRRRILAISDLHIGAYSNEHDEQRLDKMMDVIKTNKAELFALVLAGDVLEYWYFDMEQSPPPLDALTKKWKNNEWKNKEVSGLKTLKEIISFLTQNEIKIYYVRGNHDHEISQEIVEEVFGKSLRFVPHALVFETKQDDVVYRMRFEHGHDWDIYNILDSGFNQIRGRPLGYYVARCAATGKYKSGCCSQIVKNAIPYIFYAIPFDCTGSLAMKVMAWGRLNKWFNMRLLKVVYPAVKEDQDIILNERGDKISVKEIVSFPIIANCNKRFGSHVTWDMLKASMGDYTSMIRHREEDVVVVGHSHLTGALREMGKCGRKVIYCNPGCWTDQSGEGNCGIIQVEPPIHILKKEVNGSVCLIELIKQKMT